MSKEIVQLNEQVIRTELKELVRQSVKTLGQDIIHASC